MGHRRININFTFNSTIQTELSKHKNYDLPPGVTPAGEAPPETGLVIFTELPSWSILVRIPAAVAIVVIVRPGQLPYLQKIAELKRPIKISSEYDRGRHKIVQMRKRLRDLADRHDYWLEMSAIEPLLDEFDPAYGLEAPASRLAALRVRAEVASHSCLLTPRLPRRGPAPGRDWSGLRWC